VLTELVAASNGAVAQQRREHGSLRFCFQGNLGNAAAPLCDAILADFVRAHGAPPVCNSGAR
jgi:hypothetical protein